jgi:hypothetical protein
MVQSTFNDTKYTQWYLAIIEKAKQSPATGYTEKHHIVPRSLGGSNGQTNIIRLTARQHFVCHLLLIKMTSERDQRKMICAAHHMSVCHRREQYKITSLTYERLKRQRSETMRGHLNPMYGKTIKVSTKTRAKISRSLRSSAAFKASRGPAWRQKISDVQSRGVIVINCTTGEVFGEWPNCSRVAEALGCTRTNVKNAVRNGTCIGRKLKTLKNIPHFVKWKNPNGMHSNQDG